MKKKNRFTRFTALVIVILIVFSVISVRLVDLQIVDGAAYKARASTNHKFIKEAAPRGQILDSTGNILAGNKKSYNITYIETEAAKKSFYNTMAKVFYILDQNGEAQKDDFPLKVTPTYSFTFNVTNQSAANAEKIKFLSDRGFKASIIKNLYGSKKKEKELTEEEKTEVKKCLLKLSPKYVFDKLSGEKDSHNIGYEIPKSCSFQIDGKTVKKKFNSEDVRRFLIVRDAVKMQSFSGYKTVNVESNIKESTAFAFYQKLDELPGIDVAVEPLRIYPYGELASNVLGYMGKINGDTKRQEAYNEKGYDVSSDTIGVSGLESALEDRLKGSAGGRVVDVDRNGRVINEVADRDPYPGQNVRLTLNKDVQYAAERALSSVMKSLRDSKIGPNNSYTGNATRGAAVAEDVNTGAIIALAQQPNFNPNDFADPNGLSDDALNKYFPKDLAAVGKQYDVPDSLIDTLFPVDKNTGKRIDKYDYLPKPLFNYATMGLTPPGSTFKPLTAIAALETNTINPYYTVDDKGYFDDGMKFVTQFKADGPQGVNNLFYAIAKSSNAYFMTLGKLLREKFHSDDVIAEYAWKFGLGVKPNSGESASTGIEIKENFGQVFNSYSIKSSFGQQAAWQVMQDLSEKKYNKSYTVVDLYTHDSDNSEVAKLKANIKSEIRSEVISRKFNRDKFIGLLTRLLQEDKSYKGKMPSGFQMSSIAEGARGVIEHYISEATVPANTYNAAIGQGVNEFTPLQLANYVATIANGGKRYKVHLVDQVTDAVDGSVVYKFTPQVIKGTGVNKNNLDDIIKGMKMVNSIGTAAGKFDAFPFETAGKTGTADPFNDNDKERSLQRSSYALYVGFAPADKPKIAVASIVYDGGFGSQVVDIAKAIYEAYFIKVEKMTNIPKDFPMDAQQVLNK